MTRSGPGAAIDTAVSATSVARVRAAALDPARVAALARRALAEDLMGGVDLTSVATVPADRSGTGRLTARAAGVVAGLPVAAVVLELAAGPMLRTDMAAEDGATVGPGDVLMTVTGPLRGLLTGERSALNLLCHLSGVATLTRRFVDAVAGTGVAVLDTRKTTPGLRELEKYAVRCGGGQNKRMGLSDAALVKDNHVASAGGVAAAFRAVRANFPDTEVQVECDSVAQAGDALAAGATFLLCDNMQPAQLREVVALCAGRAVVEATGGVTLDTVRTIAETGVDYVSVGALTHSAPALDIGLDVDPWGPEG